MPSASATNMRSRIKKTLSKARGGVERSGKGEGRRKSPKVKPPSKGKGSGSRRLGKKEPPLGPLKPLPLSHLVPTQGEAALLRARRLLRVRLQGGLSTVPSSTIASPSLPAAADATVEKELSLLKLCPAAYNALETGILRLEDAYRIALLAEVDQTRFLTNHIRLGRKAVLKSQVRARMDAFLEFAKMFEVNGEAGNYEVRVPITGIVGYASELGALYSWAFASLCCWLGSPYS